jgi:hypothetical protein
MSSVRESLRKRITDETQVHMIYSHLGTKIYGSLQCFATIVTMDTVPFMSE